ncbi:MAG: exodeoxyribonuclease V subunit gamma, partial [Gammaproteobacteria bacterium]|nr:exodeoxyribonuclease V subunit gamma [Gammaproteobacteria bacterium]
MLRLYQSNRLEILAQRLVEQLVVPVEAPLQPETVVVQHPGMARWLTLEIAARVGICTNLRFPLPGAFVWEVFSSFLPEAPQINHFDPSLLRWRIFGLLGELAEQTLFRPVDDYLRDGDDSKRWQLAERLAGQYDRYLVYRPDWILEWEAGQSAVARDEWQAELWRRLISDQALHWVGLQKRLFDYRGERPLELPKRLFLIGVPTLSPGYLRIIQWLAQWMDIHLYLMNPCATHWADIVDVKGLARQELAADGSELYLEVGNPLLASLGRQGRDFFAAINELDPGSEECFLDPGDGNLLCRLQQQILRLEPPERGAPALDGSIEFQLFHSPMREIEGLYDQLLAMLECVPELTPSDILVMTPDIDHYAALIEAVFSAPGDRPAIPYRISDQALHRVNHQVMAFLELLGIPDSRFSVNRILGLLEMPAIHRRFGLDEAALETLTGWIEQANIRWGRDGRSKAALGLPEEPQNTWRAGLEQLLLGFAMPVDSERLWQDIVPLNAVEGSDSDWLGGLLSFSEALFSLQDQLTESQTPAAWSEILRGVIETFFYADQDAEMPLQQLRDAIRQFEEEANAAGFHGDLSLALVRQQLSKALSLPGFGRFLGGGVNFCALAPMRSLPFQVICLIGMNEGSFPRQEPRLGFDLMDRQFRFGDRSRRVDDRYLFLETILSARQRLYISYVGRSIQNNRELPPSVLVDELRDYLVQQVGEEGVEQLTHRHPLQPHGADYFRADQGLFCYSSRLREAAALAGQGQGRSQPLVTEPLAEREAEGLESIDLDRFIDFFVNPARTFAQQRLRLRLEAAGTLLEEQETFRLERYTRESLERALVYELLDGQSGHAVQRKLNAQGVLPHGRLGDLAFREMLSAACDMQDRLEAIGLGDRRPVEDFSLNLEALTLQGRLQEHYQVGQLDFSLGVYHPHRKLGLWIKHLVLSLLSPAGQAAVSIWLDRGGQGRFRQVIEPESHLMRLAALYRQGMQAPLAFYPGSSWVYAEKLLDRADPQAALDALWKKWLGTEHSPGDCYKPYQRLLM